MKPFSIHVFGIAYAKAAAKAGARAMPKGGLVHFDFSLRSSSSGLFRIRVSRFRFAVPLPHWLVVLYRCIDRFRCGLVRLV